MLLKYHSVNIPRLGHSGLEFTFAVYAYALHGLWWMLDVIGGSGKKMVRPAICFIFDSENKTEIQKDDLRRRAKKPVHFLKRVMFENYILDAVAIAEVIKLRVEEYEIADVKVNAEKVDKWIRENCNNKQYYGDEIVDRDQIGKIEFEDIVWIERVTAAEFLRKLYESILGEKYVYDKVYDSVDIAKLLIEKKNPIIFNLKNEIEEMLAKA